CVIVDKGGGFGFGMDDGGDTELLGVLVEKTVVVELGFKVGEKGDMEEWGQVGLVGGSGELAVMWVMGEEKGDWVEGNGFAGGCLGGEKGKRALE
ncbi:hypothetical protein, partial [Neisseria sicca]|uniref:hypothetical protein n=1 Tax=Neisseria sicca TaxID=490 RepID=UPI001649D497